MRAAIRRSGKAASNGKERQCEPEPVGPRIFSREGSGGPCLENGESEVTGERRVDDASRKQRFRIHNFGRVPLGKEPARTNEVIENMSHGPVTTNPLIIMCINMSIVFAVLIGLSFLIRLIHMIDPTKEKKEEPAAAPAPKAAPAPAAAPAAPAVDPNLNIAVIAAAVAAYGGDAKIVAVRPLESTGWKNVGRVSGVQNTVF